MFGSFSSQEELDRAVLDIANLKPAARTLLGKAIETQGYEVTKPSPSAKLLEDLGFLFIRSKSIFSTDCELAPSLWGEEALCAYEERKEAK